MQLSRPFLALATTLLVSISSVEAVWPKPSLMTQGNSTLLVDSSTFEIQLPSSAPQDLKDAASRSQQHIRKDSMRPLIVGRGADQVESRMKSKNYLKKVEVVLGDSENDKRGLVIGQTNYDISSLLKRDVSSIREDTLKKLEDLEEAYEIDISEDGKGTIRAKSSLGAFRALSTLEQLFYSMDKKESNMKYIEAPVKINDEPHFPYRGLMLDTARNYYSVDAIKRQLDAMSMVKLNVFHWHITDAQSFPIQLEGSLASITKDGAYSEEEIYTKEDIKEITSYAAERGINVNVEIDMPGHQYMGVKDWRDGVILHGNEPDWINWANEPPSGQLALNNSDVNEYITELIAQVTSVFPGVYFGSGGDEINLNVYGAKEESDIDSTLLKPFMQLVQNEIEKAGKINQVWEEVAINFPETGKTLKNGTIVEAWTSTDNVGKILISNPGVKIIHAPTEYFYLDCGRGEWLGNGTGQSYCERVTWGKMYQFDAYNGTEGHDLSRVLGGESALWAEQADPNNVDALLWPRAASGAEVFWTGPTYSTSSATNVSRDIVEALPRLQDLRFRMVDRGFRAEPLQPMWCTLRPGQCEVPQS